MFTRDTKQVQGAGLLFKNRILLSGKLPGRGECVFCPVVDGAWQLNGSDFRVAIDLRAKV